MVGTNFLVWVHNMERSLTFGTKTYSGLYKYHIVVMKWDINVKMKIYIVLVAFCAKFAG